MYHGLYYCKSLQSAAYWIIVLMNQLSFRSELSAECLHVWRIRAELTYRCAVRIFPDCDESPNRKTVFALDEVFLLWQVANQLLSLFWTRETSWWCAASVRENHLSGLHGSDGSLRVLPVRLGSLVQWLEGAASVKWGQFRQLSSKGEATQVNVSFIHDI